MSSGRVIPACLLLIVTVAPVDAAPPGPPCGDPFAYQVLLDTHGFSSGQIDGKPGNNTTRALRAFQESQRLP